MAFLHASGHRARHVEVSAKLLRDDKRTAVLIDDGVNHVWLPKKFVKIEPVGKGFVSVFMPVWLAKLKGYWS